MIRHLMDLDQNITLTLSHYGYKRANYELGIPCNNYPSVANMTLSTMTSVN